MRYKRHFLQQHCKKCLQFDKKAVYCKSKVNLAREVLRLGKGVNERAHLPCGAMFGPLQKGGVVSFANRTCFVDTFYGLLLQTAKGVFFMNSTLKITCTAMLTALSVALNFLTIQLTGSSSLSFVMAICLVAGIYLGVRSALIVGYVGDLIAHLIHPYGPYNWFIALSVALWGTICALVYKLPIKSKIVKLAITLVACFAVCNCALNTFGLWLQYQAHLEPGLVGLIEFIKNGAEFDKSFWVYLGGRLPFIAINVVANGIVVGVIQQTKVLDKLLLQLNHKKTK